MSGFAAELGGGGVAPAPYYAFWRPTAGQSIAGTGVEVVVTYPTLVESRGAGLTYSGGTFTCTVPGLYSVMGYNEYFRPSGVAETRVYRNYGTGGVQRLTNDVIRYDPANTIRSVFGCIVQLAVGDTLTVTASQNSGGADPINGNAGYSGLQIARLG